MSHEPIRVLHVIDQLTGGGAEVSLVEYLTNSAARDDLVHAMVVLNGQPATVDVAGSLPITVTVGAPGRRPRFSDASFVSETIREFRPDVVHCALVRSTLATARALRGTDLPMLVTLTSVHYDVEDKGGSLKQRWGIRLTHALHGMALRRPRVSFHAVSQPVADKAIEVFRINPRRIKVVPRGRPDPRQRLTIDRLAVRDDLGIDPSAPTLIVVAREHLVKNHIALLESVANLLDEFEDLAVLFVGGRSTASETIDRWLEASPLAGHVLRLGHRDDVPDLLAASDVFVSTSSSEGLPGAIVEAMGIGLPVVAFDAPGVRDVLGDDHPLMVPFGDKEALTGRIRETLSNNVVREEMSRLDRRIYEESFEIDAYSARLRDVYRGVTGRTDITVQVEPIPGKAGVDDSAQV